MQPIAANRGATSIRSLGEREALMRSVVQERTLRALRDEEPLAVVRPGARVFRITHPTGYSIVFDIEREVRSAQGDLIRPSKHSLVQFKASQLSGAFGEVILDPIPREDSLRSPEDEKARAALDARRIAIVEDEMRRRPEIVDWHKLREQEREEHLEETAKALADPSFAKAVVEQARRLGVNLAEGFADVLRPKASVGAAPIQKG